MKNDNREPFINAERQRIDSDAGFLRQAPVESEGGAGDIISQIERTASAAVTKEAPRQTVLDADLGVIEMENAMQGHAPETPFPAMTLSESEFTSALEASVEADLASSMIRGGAGQDLVETFRPLDAEPLDHVTASEQTEPMPTGNAQSIDAASTPEQRAETAENFLLSDAPPALEDTPTVLATTGDERPQITTWGPNDGDSGDNVTSATTLTFEGTGTAGSFVGFWVNGRFIEGAQVQGGQWTVTIDDLDPGTNVFMVAYIRAVDDYEKPLSNWTVQPVIIDTDPIPLPTIDYIVDDRGTYPDDEVTSDPRPIIHGTAEGDATVELKITGPGGFSVTRTVQADGGNWSYQHDADFADGDYEVVAKQILPRGTSGETAAFPITIDTNNGGTVETDPPTIDRIDPDTGIDNDDMLTNNPRPVIHGTAEPEAVVEITIDDSFTTTVIADTNGAWSYQHTTRLPEGDVDLKVRQKDKAGNDWSDFEDEVVTIDTVPPRTPDLDRTGGDIVSGTVHPDDVDDGLLVYVKLPDGSVHSTTAEPDGTWSLDVDPDLVDNDQVEAWAEDNAGNKSGSDFETVDTTPPSRPTVDEFSFDSGDRGDGITNDDTLKFEGTAEEGLTVRVEVYKDEGGTLTLVTSGETIANQQNAWIWSHDGQLDDGDYKVVAVAIDEERRVESAPSAPLPVTVDTNEQGTDPTDAPTITGIDDSDDSGIADDDNYTNVRRPVVEGAGAEDGATIRVYGNSGVLLGSTTVGSGGTWSLQLDRDLTEGENELYATQQDVAGNAESVSSTTIDVTLDTVSPDRPQSVASNGASVSGTVYVDDAQDGAWVMVETPNGSIHSIQADPDGTWSIPITPPLSDNDTVKVWVEDRAGNKSRTVDTVVDTTPPAAPIIDGFSDDTGVAGVPESLDDGVTHDTTPRIFGHLGDNNTDVTVILTITGPGGYSEQRTAVLDKSTGNWSYQFQSGEAWVTNGDYTVTAHVTANGLDSAADTLTITLDTVGGPGGDTPAPTITDITDATNSGDDSDLLTNVKRPVVIGTGAEQGGTIIIYNDDGDELGRTYVASGGAWSVQLTDDLDEGDNVLHATQRDAAGNPESDPSNDLTVTLDTTPPDAPSFTTVGGTTVTGTITAAAAAEGVEVWVEGPDGVPRKATVDYPNRTWSVTFNPALQDGEEIVAWTVDPADNKSSEVPREVDLSPLDAPIVDSFEQNTGNGTPGSDSDEFTTDTTPLIRGHLTDTNVDPSDMTVTVYIKQGNTIVHEGEAVLQTNGRWSYQVPAGEELSDGSYTITATVTDARPVTSGPSNALPLVIDSNNGGNDPTQAPDVTAITPDTDQKDFVTEENELIFHGDGAEEGAVVQIRLVHDGGDNQFGNSNDTTIEAGTTAARDNGDWSFDFQDTQLQNGSWRVYVRQQDSAGNDWSDWEYQDFFVYAPSNANRMMSFARDLPEAETILADLARTESAPPPEAVVELESASAMKATTATSTFDTAIEMSEVDAGINGGDAILAICPPAPQALFDGVDTVVSVNAIELDLAGLKQADAGGAGDAEMEPFLVICPPAPDAVALVMTDADILELEQLDLTPLLAHDAAGAAVDAIKPTEIDVAVAEHHAVMTNLFTEQPQAMVA